MWHRDPMIGQVLDQIQREQVQWVHEQFPGRSETYPLLGIVEEVGELVEAMALRDPNGFEDAIGDVLLYLSDYATSQDWTMSDLLSLGPNQERPEVPPEAGLMVSLGRLAKARIKGERGIRGSAVEWRERGRQAAASVLADLRVLVTEDDEFERIAKETWGQVRARDWNRFPHDGCTA